MYMTIEMGSVPYIKGGGDGGAGGGGTAGGAGGGGGAFLQQPSHWQFSHVRSSEQVNSSDMWNQSRHFLLRHMLLHAGISSDTGGGGGEAGGEEGGGGGPGGDGGGEGDGGEGGGGGGDGRRRPRSRRLARRRWRRVGLAAAVALAAEVGERVLQLIVAVTPCHHRHVLPSRIAAGRMRRRRRGRRRRFRRWRDQWREWPLRRAAAFARAAVLQLHVVGGHDANPARTRRSVAGRGAGGGRRRCWR